MHVLNQLKTLLEDPQLQKENTIQSLWSGYGEIARMFSPKLNAPIIVKWVSPPTQVQHPRGWHSDIGHARKLKSYQVEAAFYQHYAQMCDEHCYMPKLIALEQVNDVTQVQQLMVMEDLVALGFDTHLSEVSLTDIKSIIHWLAYFHARFLKLNAPELWPVGTYWHLATRPDEFAQMEASDLKQAANKIDAKLNQAKYQTLVHGDAKLANFGLSYTLFDARHIDALRKVAAVDFQYVGRGVGVKDLAYFLGSCLDDAALSLHHENLLDYYFTELKAAIHHFSQDIDVIALEAEWRSLYAFACADFMRFLQGWSPEHHKINRYLQQQTQNALGALKGINI